ncbi:MAG: hypothetical protein CFH16_00191 [Alphaproteobacteria bacterium MarineAlpha5_Bin6]|nr:MAG: hypothetical protein CFH17_00898 [Alphaproteobacteria bacterium MarineAlpha5_Bin7]PPR54742.1 MAG: hypothetical protein CFH16_00191 [Alphaproteobacteria bacterium MarineAlpha5_Bin6]
MIKKFKIELFVLVVLFLSIFISYNIDLGLYKYFSGFDNSLQQIYLKDFFVKITVLGESQWYFFLSILLMIFAFILDKGNFLIRLKKHKKVYFDIGLFLFVSLLVTGFLTQLLKHIVGRARPNYSSFDGSVGFDFLNFNSSFHSFPSGHVSTIFVVALVCAFFLSRLKYFFILFAFIVGFSRIVVGAHFFTDVIGGIIIAYIGFKLSKIFLEKYFPVSSLTHKYVFINNRIFLVLVFVVSGMIVFSVGPSLDIYLSSLFYFGDNQFLLQSYYDITIFFRKILLRAIIVYMLILPFVSMFLPIKQLFFNYNFKPKDIFFIWVFGLINIVLVVNLLLKSFWGRARPGEILQLGGKEDFTAWYEISDACSKNCSFVSGDAAVGFSVIVLYFLTNKVIFIWMSLVLGFSLGLIRILEGGHFVSDVLGALIVVYFLFYFQIKFLKNDKS